MRLPGFEPGLEAISLLLARLLPAKGCWEAPVITAGPQPQNPDYLFKTLFKQYIVYGLNLIFLQPQIYNDYALFRYIQFL